MQPGSVAHHPTSAWYPGTLGTLIFISLMHPSIYMLINHSEITYPSHSHSNFKSHFIRCPLMYLCCHPHRTPSSCQADTLLLCGCFINPSYKIAYSFISFSRYFSTTVFTPKILNTHPLPFLNSPCSAITFLYLFHFFFFFQILPFNLLGILSKLIHPMTLGVVSALFSYI